MSFDPFGDFETRGHLRNFECEKNLELLKRFEHAEFVEMIAEAFGYLAPIRHLTYGDVLHVHKILFGSVYPWAGQDRQQTAPEIAVSKGTVLFAHPNDVQKAVSYALNLGNDKSVMAARPGEVLGYLAYGHPFLDGNGRTIFVVHTELAQRAGISVDWAATNKAAYLNALTQEIERPGAGHLDNYLKPFLREAVGVARLAQHVLRTRGLDGRSSTEDENRVAGKVSDAEVLARYNEQRLNRQAIEKESGADERER
jgi:cell filamentation protein